MREAVVRHHPPTRVPRHEWRDKYRHRWISRSLDDIERAALSAGMPALEEDELHRCAVCHTWRFVHRGRVVFFAPEFRMMKTDDPACVKHGRW